MRLKVITAATVLFAAMSIRAHAGPTIPLDGPPPSYIRFFSDPEMTNEVGTLLTMCDLTNYATGQSSLYSTYEPLYCGY